MTADTRGSQAEGAQQCTGGKTQTRAGNGGGPDKKKRPTAASMHAEQMEMSKKILDAIEELCGSATKTKVTDTPEGREIHLELDIPSMLQLMREVGAPLLHMAIAALNKNGCHTDVPADPVKVDEATTQTGTTPDEVATELTLEVVDGKVTVLSTRVDALEARFVGMEDGQTVTELVTAHVGGLKSDMVTAINEASEAVTNIANEGDAATLKAANEHTDTQIGKVREDLAAQGEITAEAIAIVSNRMADRNHFPWGQFAIVAAITTIVSYLLLVWWNDGDDRLVLGALSIGVGIGVGILGAILVMGDEDGHTNAWAAARARVTTRNNNDNAAPTANPPVQASANTGSGSGGDAIPSSSPAPATSGTPGA